MAKWQELFFTGLINASVGLWLAGVIRLVLDGKDIISSIVVIVLAVYLFLVVVFISKSIDNKGV